MKVKNYNSLYVSNRIHLHSKEKYCAYLLYCSTTGHIIKTKQEPVITFDFYKVVFFSCQKELCGVCSGQVDVRLSVGTSVTHSHVLLVH